MLNTTPGAGVAVSETGWSNTEIFKEYMVGHFLKHVQRSDPAQPILLLLDGHSTHTSLHMVHWAMEHNIHLFVLPAHTSHITQPLDVAVFGPFKRYYYSECADYMRQNMGKTITRYQIASMACTAYLKAMSPWNIVSSFKKTGIFPLNKDAIAAEKMMPCEPFRDETPVEKVHAMRGGKEAVDAYFLKKMEGQQVERACDCKTKKKQTKRPKSGGKEITTAEFVEEMTAYETEKENVAPTKTASNLPSPRPSTSGITATRSTRPVAQLCLSYDEDDEFLETEDTETCCVCGLLRPPNMDQRPYLKIINWAECEQCKHWVHLSFCDEKRALRKDDIFLCIHCR